MWRERNRDKRSVERDATGRGVWRESNRERKSVEREKQGEEEYGKRATIENSSNIENEPKSVLSVFGSENGNIHDAVCH